MKRHGRLFDKLVAWPNLLRAARRARRGKRFRPNVAAFEYDLEGELLQLQAELIAGTYRPGAYHTFTIFEPKRRLISAAPYRDRVVHHALCNVIEPLLDRTFIHDSYACRAGKGTHAAVRRAAQFARRSPYVLQGDLQQFFPSLDHELLLAQIARKLKDPRVLNLIAVIVAHSNPQDPVDGYFPGDDLFTATERRRGLPIGNQTSQFFANVFLDPLDHFVKETLRAPGYVRYVDDFLVFGDDKHELAASREAIRRFLAGMRLRLHPRKSVIFPVTQGIRFLGYRVFPTHRRLDKQNVRRFRRRLKMMQREYAAGRISLDDIRTRIMSWLGHAKHADTWQLIGKLLERYTFSRGRSHS